MKPQIELGDTVKFPKYLTKTKNYPKVNLGLVVEIDGGYYNIQPTGCWWMAEFYHDELTHISRWGGTKKQLKEYCGKFRKFYKYMINSEGNI